MSLMMMSMVFVMVTMSIASGRRIAEVLNQESDLTSPENGIKYLFSEILKYPPMAPLLFLNSLMSGTYVHCDKTGGEPVQHLAPVGIEFRRETCIRRRPHKARRIVLATGWNAVKSDSRNFPDALKHVTDMTARADNAEFHCWFLTCPVFKSDFPYTVACSRKILQCFSGFFYMSFGGSIQKAGMAENFSVFSISGSWQF